MIVPNPVHAGATLRAAHLAGPVDRQLFSKGVRILKARGFEVQRDVALGDAPPGLPFLAGEDWARARELTHSIMSPQIDAIVAARGGYGTMRLLERVPNNLLASNPKWLVGYSDVTALHLWAYAQGVASIHGPMVAGLVKHQQDDSLQELAATLSGAPPQLAVESSANRRIVGRLIGGNLSLLAAMRPTRWWPDLAGCILFIEEIGEPLYRVDRMIQTLLVAGGLEQLGAVVLGQFTGCGERQGGPSAAVALVRETLLAKGIAVATDASAGHGAPNLSFVHGGRYELGDQVLRYLGESKGAKSAKATKAAIRTPKSAENHGLPELLELAVSSGICSAAQLVVSVRGEVVHSNATGTNGVEGEAIGASTQLDTASVTKAVSTALLAHRALEVGAVELQDRCPAKFSAAQPTLRNLLRHSSGLPAHIEVFRGARESQDPKRFAEKAFASIGSTEKGPRYSDVGYIALGRWIEALLGDDIASLFAQHIASPLGLRSCFGPVKDAVVTEYSPFHGEFLRGLVHDENAQALGGAAGHAGLFSSAQDLDVILRSLLGHGPQILKPSTVEQMWDHSQRPDGGTYTLGWDTPSGTRSNAGALMSRSATVGHLGFTGTSVWVDRDAELAVTLLTNRVYPTRDNAGIRWLRPAIQDAAYREFG